MPNINPVAKKWEFDLAERVGRAVATRRSELGLTAVQVAARTASLGYPITRQAIAKIENNNRAGKLDVAELIVLAAALSISPIQLLYPDLVDGPVEVHPGKVTTSLRAADWFVGTEILGDATRTIDDLSRTTYTETFFGGIVPLNRASAVGRARLVVLTLLSNPEWGIGPGTDEFQKALSDLERAKVNARLEGLILEDGQDG